MQRFSYSAILALLAVAPAAAQFQPLGLSPGYPQITGARTASDALTYNASTGALTVFSGQSSSPLRYFPAVGGVPANIAGGLMTIRLVVSNTGALVSGDPGHDFIITGSTIISGTPYASPLLTGEILQFGGADVPGNVDSFEFRFQVTGGSMAPLFANGNLGVKVSGENSTMAGFGTSFVATTTKPTIGPVCSGMIGDYVWLDANQNGVQETSETGLNGIRVQLRDGQGNVIADRTTEVGPNGAAGFYRFENLCAGSYSVTVDASTVPPGFEETATGQGSATTDSNTKPASVTLAANNSSDLTIDFGYRAPCSGVIGDYVFYDANNDGLQTTGDLPFAGVTVQLSGGALTAPRTAVTNNAGLYQFTGVCAGNYQVQVLGALPGTLAANGQSTTNFLPRVYTGPSNPANDSNSGVVPVSLTVEANQDLTIDFGYYNNADSSPRPGRLGDRVWIDVNGDTVQDPGEPGLVGWTVQLWDLTRTTVLQSQTTIANGIYTFENVFGGRYVVCVVPQPGVTQTYDLDGVGTANCAEVQLPSGGERMDVDFGYRYPTITVSCLSIGGLVEGVPLPSGIQYAATGGGVGGPYAYAATGLPAGVSMAPNGTISGTPTVSGNFSYEVTVTDSLGNFSKVTCTLVVNPRPSATCIAINAVQGRAIAPVTMVGAGGVGGPYGFSAVGLPPGITMDANGTISGTPTATGIFSYTVTITDRNGNTGTLNCSVTVLAAPSATCIAINAVQGIAITPVTMLGTGGAGAPYQFSATGLPAGLTMSTGGTISGTPTVNGTFNYTVTITDKDGNVGTVNCSVTVLAPVSATCISINAVQGIAIAPVTMLGTGGAGAPYQFSATGLPAGLTMSTGGTISGTPTVNGTFNYTVTITDKDGNVGTVNCSVTVLAPVSATCISINAVQGRAITPVTMLGTGGAGAPYQFSATGLPAGLTMSTGGTISGTPTVNGIFNYTVTVTDRSGNTGTVNCSVTVVTPPSANCLVISAVRGTALTTPPMVGSGGIGPYTFSATGLPAGLTMAGNGSISGTPTVAGTFPYTVTIRDSANNTSTLNCSVTVTDPAPPPPAAICPRTQGYWKNHEERWPVTSLVLGSQTYTKAELLDIFDTPVRGDQSLNLAHQLIAAKLNAAAGANTTSITAVFTAADALLALYPGKLPYDVKSGSNATSMNTRAGQLDAFNNGANSAGCLDVQPPLVQGKIGNYVWRDTDSDGIQDSNESGIRGVVVTLRLGSTVIATDTTDSNGAYSFEGLVAGTYTVSVATPSGLTPTTVNGSGSTASNDSNLHTGATATLATNSSSDLTIDFGFRSTTAACTGVIGDFVWNDANNNGRQDSGETGIKGVTVTLRNGTTVVGTDITDLQGKYEFTGLCAGNYTVETSIPSGFVRSTPTAAGSTTANDSNPHPAPVTLATSATVDRTVDFGFYCPPVVATGSIGNFVWRDANGNGIQDSGEPGISGATVRLLRNNTVLATTTTNAAGQYLFSNLAAGSYRVDVTAPSGLVLTTVDAPGSNDGNDSDPDPSTVTLATAQSNLTIDFGFAPVNLCGAAIGDRVWRDANGNGLQDSGEAGIAGVKVNLLNNRNNTLLRSTTTDSMGYYRFDGLAAGTYKVQVVTPSGLTPTTANVGTNRSVDSSTSPVTVTLPTGSSNDMTVDFGFRPATTGGGSNICGLSPGYWKNHNEAWTIETVMLGGRSYSETEMMSILSGSSTGDASKILGRQLVAAKLNVANGVNAATAGGAIADADALLAQTGRIPAGVSTTSSLGRQMVAVATRLDAFNNDGQLQPGCLCTNAQSPDSNSSSGDDDDDDPVTKKK